jgi:putative endonuclease
MRPDGTEQARRARRLGEFGERVAALHLEAKGFRVVGTNIRLLGGEIDLIACNESTTVFVEVRTRRGERYGTPEESISARKASKLLSVAAEYLERHAELPQAARIDLVAIAMDAGGLVQRVTHLEDVLSS